MNTLLETQVHHILNEATIENNIVKLNSGQLERDVYTKVNEVLTRLWGKWDLRKGGHVFTYDPTDALQVYIKTKKLPPKNELSYFPTPNKIIDEIIENIKMSFRPHIKNILEPSAGQGAIADKLKTHFPDAHIDCVEISDIHSEVLRNKKYKTHQQDFLEYQTDEKYDLIVMNPPFNTPGNKNCYIDHIQHAFDMLDRRGSLYAIAPLNWVNRNDKKHKEFREWLSTVVSDKYLFGAGDFKDVGTMIQTCLLTIDSTDKISEDLTLRNFVFFYNGDYGYEYYRKNDENKNLNANEYFDKCFIDSLDPKKLLDVLSWDHRDKCISCCEKRDLEQN